MTWNLHHGAGLDGRVDLERIARLIRAQKPHLVALEEVDKGVARTDRRDQPAELARLTGMTCVFSNNFHFQGGEYGNAILTRLPVRQWTNTHLPMLRAGEQRGALRLRATWRGAPLCFVATHLDYRRDNAERLQNVTLFQQWAKDTPPPAALFIAGDFNDFPDRAVYRAMSRAFRDAWREAGKGPGFTFPGDRPHSRIDYVWVSRAASWRAVRAWIPASRASDHRPLVVDFARAAPTE
jgi:endonuclease/exonuclease/phosphatase family metal-dependent hydrolase